MYVFLLTFLMKLQYMDILTAFYPMAFNLMFDEFLFQKKRFFHIHCNFMFITFLNDLPHSMQVTSYGVSSLFSSINCFSHFLMLCYVFGILCMFSPTVLTAHISATFQAKDFHMLQTMSSIGVS